MTAVSQTDATPLAVNRSYSAVLGAIMLDTLREALARWLFWGLFGLSTLLILIFLFVLKIDVVEGAVSVLGSDRTHQVDIRDFVLKSYSFVSVFLYIWGTFLAVFASSGLIPSVLEAGRISLLLSKPVSRTTLLLGRYLGNFVIVAANHIYLIFTIWFLIGLKTSIWEPRFLISIVGSLFIFAVLLTVVVLVGVVSESAALAVMIPVALMLISTLLAQHRFVVKALSSEWSRQLWMAFYWIIPKVYDLSNAMKQLIVFDRQVDWWTPVWTSALFGAVVLTAAVRIFERRDF